MARHFVRNAFLRSFIVCRYIEFAIFLRFALYTACLRLLGFENNCTRKISSKDPLEIVLLKGVFSGLGSIIIGLCIGERITILWSVFAVLGVGFVAYGLSIFFTFMLKEYSARRAQARIMPLRRL